MAVSASEAKFFIESINFVCKLYFMPLLNIVISSLDRSVSVLFTALS